MSMINFVLGWVEHERGFVTSGPGCGMCHCKGVGLAAFKHNYVVGFLHEQQ